jgi:hypothetical protein
MTCPVVAAIREIRGAGLYKDDCEESPDDVIKLGGNNTDIEFVCDDMTFYMMTRRMELARFELSKPDFAQCKAKYTRMFKNIVGIDYSTLYTRIINQALKKKFLYKQFVELVELIGETEQLIEIKVNSAARRGVPINISIPDIILLPHIDQLIIYRTDILCATMNKIINYMNKINVNSLLSEPVNSNIPQIKPFAVTPPDMKTQIPEIDATDADEFLAGMKRTLEHEMAVASYIREVEKYQCGVINHVNMAYDVCKKIIDGIQ